MRKKVSLLMLMGLVLLLSGCREELDYLDNNTQNTYQLSKDNVKTQILQRKDYEARSFLKPSVDAVNAYLKSQHAAPVSSSSKVSSQDISGIALYTDVFEEVSYLNATYYSFYLIGTEAEPYEKKLILKYTDHQLAGKYILSYQRLNDFRIAPNSFRLEKLVSSPSSGNENSLIMSEISLSVGCTNYTITTFNCGHDGNHSNGQFCEVDGIRMPYDVVSSVYTANCQPGTAGGTVGTPGDGSGTGIPTGGGPVEGGTGTDQTPDIITLPTTAPLYVIQRPKGIICNTLNLDPEEITQINSNDNVRLRIYQYLALWGINPQLCNGIMTQEAEEFIKAALAYFKDHPNDNWQDYYNDYLATPCEQIKAQRNDATFNNNITNLQDKTSLKKETGYIQKNGGDYVYMDNANATDEYNSLALPYAPTNTYIKGYMHTHVNDYSYTNSEGYVIEKIGVKIFSPSDIKYFMQMLKNARNNNRPLGNVYAIMIATMNNYQIRFSGNSTQIKEFTEQQEMELNEDFADDMKNKKNKVKTLELGFLTFLEEKMQITGVNLYRMNSDGSTTEIHLNPDKTDTVENTCPI